MISVVKDSREIFLTTYECKLHISTIPFSQSQINIELHFILFSYILFCRLNRLILERLCYAYFIVIIPYCAHQS